MTTHQRNPEVKLNVSTVYWQWSTYHSTYNKHTWNNCFFCFVFCFCFATRKYFRVSTLSGARNSDFLLPCFVTAPIGLVVERSLGVQEVIGSILGRVTGGMLCQCAYNIAFKCGSTISATSRHLHDMTDILLKVTLN